MNSRIKSFIFLDFETTGLFYGGAVGRIYKASPDVKSSTDPQLLSDELKEVNAHTIGGPRITEMSFVAVTMEDFTKAVDIMKETFQKADGNASIRVEVPFRVHTRIVKPSLYDTMWDTYEKKQKKEPHIFVHSKEKLLEMNDFPFEWKELREFLESVPKPACFVAHNGIGFDYRILFCELRRSGMFEDDATKVPEGILFIDSLLAVQNIEEKQNNARVVQGDHDENECSPAIVRRQAASIISIQQPVDLKGKRKRKSSRGPTFNLPGLYSDIIKDSSITMHHAQADCEAMIQVLLAYGQDFLDYAEKAAADLPF